MGRIVTCAECGQEKPYWAKGLCRVCYYRPYMHRYRQEHREDIVAYNHRWAQEHQEERVAYKRLYYQEHREEIAARLHCWVRENRPKKVANEARRKARKRNAVNTLTAEQIEFERTIGEATYPGEKLHMHHWVPLSKGGGHAWGNIGFIPWSLNLIIGTKLPEEIYQQGALIELW